MDDSGGNGIVNMLRALKKSNITSYTELAKLFAEKEASGGEPLSLTNLSGPYPNHFTQSFDVNQVIKSKLYIFDEKNKYTRGSPKPVTDFGIYYFEKNPYHGEDENDAPYELIALDSLYMSTLIPELGGHKELSVWDLEGTTTDRRGNEREMLEYTVNRKILLEPWYNEGLGGIKPFFSAGNPTYVITYADFMSLMKNMPRFINWTKTKPFK
tara:strand:+ start:250 stop:885 length:636 start_codon:yes stop_codon:yes gene_type:complete